MIFNPTVSKHMQKIISPFGGALSFILTLWLKYWQISNGVTGFCLSNNLMPVQTQPFINIP